MSKELPALKPRQVVKALESAGYVQWRQKGSHLFMHRASDHRSVTVPVHFRKSLPKGTLHAIVKEAGLTTEEFLRLL